jgi:hypothetical protein
MKFIFPEKTGKSNMIKFILEITRINLFKYKKSEKSPQEPLRISWKSVLIPRKISGLFYAKSPEKYMEFEENNDEFEGKITRYLKEKHREFFTRVVTFPFSINGIPSFRHNPFK